MIEVDPSNTCSRADGRGLVGDVDAGIGPASHGTAAQQPAAPEMGVGETTEERTASQELQEIISAK